MTYADDFNLRAPQHVKLNDIADAVDGLLITSTQDISDAEQEITSTSYADMTDMAEAVTVADGETVLIYAEFRMVIATANDVGSWLLKRDATSLAERTLLAITANGQHWISCFYLDRVPAAGAYTYKMQIKNETGARSIKTTVRRFCTIKFQES